MFVSFFLYLLRPLLTPLDELRIALIPPLGLEDDLPVRGHVHAELSTVQVDLLATVAAEGVGDVARGLDAGVGGAEGRRHEEQGGLK